MEEKGSLLSRARRMNPKNSRRGIVLLLACLAILGTLYALVLPAVTLEGNDTDPKETIEAKETLIQETEGSTPEEPTPEKEEKEEKEKEDNTALREAPLRAPNYDVWFDGTMGQGTAVNYYPGATNTHAVATNGVVTLPTTAGNPSQYMLNGWYDITSGVYYGKDKLGTSVTVSKNTVFYADWVPKSDDYRDPNRQLAPTIDTSSFIRTELFDYNELINLQSGRLTSSSISSSSHSETWGFNASQNDAFNFAFSQWAYYEAAGNRAGRIGFLNNLNDRNSYHSNDPYRLELGIVTSESDTILQTLFTDSGTPGVRKVGEGGYLYQYDRETGYYYYNNAQNGAAFQASDGRFYVYSNPSYIQGQQLSGRTWTNKSDLSAAFMPLNSQSRIGEKDGSGNFWFGMKNTIDFFLPETPGTNGGNCNYSTTGSPMEFRFSGDDDIWVFVDGVLVLDLGGIHGTVDGVIDFSKGTVTQSGTTHALPSSIKEGEHTLTIYYLERGSSKSNCSIYFNICPRYALELTKADAETQALLNGAEFTIYTDQACTIPAQLWSSKEAFDNGEAARCTFSVENGLLHCWGLSAGKTYYIKETLPPPSGYANVSEAVIALELDSRGNPSATVTDPSGLIGVTEVDRDSEIQRIRMTVTNQKPETTYVRAEKIWLDADGRVTNEGETLRLQLYRSMQLLGGSGKRNVFITTQYFSHAAPGGSNSDQDPILQGDFSRVFSVSNGSDLKLELRSLSGAAGFYSVMANGAAVTPENAVEGTENCYIGGTWGKHPLQSADYRLTNITADQHVVITLIGYPNWDGDTVSVEKTITVSYTETLHEPETPPGDERPSDAEPIGNPVTVTPTENGVWFYEWNNLPCGDGENVYYYYVEELPLDGYETTYSHNGIQGGIVTITNRALPLSGLCLEIFKTSSDSTAPLAGAKFDLYRPSESGEGGVSLPGESGLFIKINRSPITTGADGRAVRGGLEPGVYYLVETAAPAGYVLNSTPHRIELTETSALTNDPIVTGNPNAPSVTVTNEPKDVAGDLIVEKNWFRQLDQTGTVTPDDPPVESLAFRLIRSYQTRPVGATITIIGKHAGNQAGTVLLQDEAAPGTTFRFYVCGVRENGWPDSSNRFTVTCTGGTVQRVSQTHPTSWSWYNAPVYEVTIPASSTGVTINVGSNQTYRHYLADYVAGYEPQAPTGGGETVEEIVSVDGSDVLWLSAENGWSMGFSREDLGEEPGVDYTYRVEEIAPPEGYLVSYRVDESADGQIYLIMENTRIFHEFELPETGGSGTRLCLLCGGAMILGAAGFYGCAWGRKRKERG